MSLQLKIGGFFLNSSFGNAQRRPIDQFSKTLLHHWNYPVSFLKSSLVTLVTHTLGSTAIFWYVRQRICLDKRGNKVHTEQVLKMNWKCFFMQMKNSLWQKKTNYSDENGQKIWLETYYMPRGSTLTISGLLFSLFSPFSLIRPDERGKKESVKGEEKVSLLGADTHILVLFTYCMPCSI